MDTVKRTLELLNKHQMTIYQLTQESGISRATIMQTERRGGQLKIDTIQRICDVLGITLSEFFEESTEREKEKPQRADSCQSAAV